MPEVGVKNHPVVEEIKQRKDSGSGFDGSTWDVQSLPIELRQQVLGSGQEYVVVRYPGNETRKVLAFAYKNLSPAEAKKIYYSQRIMAMMFPDNFPQFNAAFGSDEASESMSTGTVRQRVLYPSRRVRDNNIEVKKPFSEVRRACHELGLGFREDINRSNRRVSEDGKEYYLDKVSFKDVRALDKKKIGEYMANQGRSDVETRRVMKSIDRLVELEVEGETRSG